MPIYFPKSKFNPVWRTIRCGLVFAGVGKRRIAAAYRGLPDSLALMAPGPDVRGDRYVRWASAALDFAFSWENSPGGYAFWAANYTALRRWEEQGENLENWRTLARELRDSAISRHQKVVCSAEAPIC